MLQIASAVPTLATGHIAAPALQVAASRGAIPVQLWNRLVGRIQKDEGVPLEQAERIMDSTLGFLELCADNPERRFAPAPLVDIGWHTFILYTQGYARFCRTRAGRFLHHEPNDKPGAPMEAGGACATVAFMKERGMSFDSGMWAHPSADADCDGGNGPGPTSDCTCS